MDYKVGDKVKNGAGNICTVGASCSKCGCLIGGPIRAKCYMQNICPAWDSSYSETKPDKYLDELNKAIDRALDGGSDVMSGLLLAKSIYNNYKHK